MEAYLSAFDPSTDQSICKIGRGTTTDAKKVLFLRFHIFVSVRHQKIKGVPSLPDSALNHHTDNFIEFN